MVVGIFTFSIFLFVNAFYNVGMAYAKYIAMNGYKTGKQPPDDTHPFGYGREEYRVYFRVGLIIIVSSIVFMIYSMRLFITGSNAYYPMVIAIAIAAVTFTEIGMAIQGAVSMKKRREVCIEATKMANLASSLISLVLTQTAILSFTMEGNNSVYNGISGMVFGGCAALIGVYMLLYMSRIMKGKHYASILKKLDRAIKKSTSSISIEPVKYEDHGPGARLLYANIKSVCDNEDLIKLKDKIKHSTGVDLIEVSSQ